MKPVKSALRKRGRKPGGKDFSPRVRSLFDHAIREELKNGTLLDTLRQQLREDPVGTMQKMAPYAPKQVDVDMQQTVTVDTTQLSDQLLREVILGIRDEPAEANTPVH